MRRAAVRSLLVDGSARSRGLLGIQPAAELSAKWPSPQDAEPNRPSAGQSPSGKCWSALPDKNEARAVEVIASDMGRGAFLFRTYTVIETHTPYTHDMNQRFMPVFWNKFDAATQRPVG